MGAWGTDTFDNDTACDFAAEISEMRDLKKLEAALDRVIQAATAYLQATDGEEGLAAADIVARLNGIFGARNAYTQRIDTWVTQSKFSATPALLEKAKLVVARIQTEPSELLELWNDSSEAANWKASVQALANRL